VEGWSEVPDQQPKKKVRMGTALYSYFTCIFGDESKANRMESAGKNVSFLWTSMSRNLNYYYYMTIRSSFPPRFYLVMATRFLCGPSNKSLALARSDIK
jgi:hypothetical protein